MGRIFSLEIYAVGRSFGVSPGKCLTLREGAPRETGPPDGHAGPAASARSSKRPPSSRFDRESPSPNPAPGSCARASSPTGVIAKNRPPRLPRQAGGALAAPPGSHGLRVKRQSPTFCTVGRYPKIGVSTQDHRSQEPAKTRARPAGAGGARALATKSKGRPVPAPSSPLPPDPSPNALITHRT